MKQIHNNTTENLKQLSNDTLIIGVDIAKITNVARAVDFRGIELGKAISFNNNYRGFADFMRYVRELKTIYSKTDVIIGMEPTGPYGHTLAQFLKNNDIHTVLVLGMQVNKAKELDDNTPSKNDKKDALIIASLIKDGRFRKLREFDDNISDLKEAMSHHNQLTKNLTRVKNQIDNWISRYFPEFNISFKDWEKKTALATLRCFPLPSDIKGLSSDEIVKAWRHNGVMRGIGQKKASQLRLLCMHSVGLKTALEFAKLNITDLLTQYELYMQQLTELWILIDTLLKDIPLFEKVMTIPNISVKSAAGIISEIGDPSDFKHPKQLVRLAGLSLKESSSGGRRGMSEITKRGRPKLRRVLYLAVLDLLKRRSGAFYALHMYNTKLRENPLKPMQSVIALCCKLLRVIWGMSVSGGHYDPDIVSGRLALPEAS